MDLLVDIGNTAVKWAYLGDDGLSDSRRAYHGSHDGCVTMPEAIISGPVPGRVLVSNVAGPAVSAAYTEAMKTAWGVAPRFIRPQPSGFGIQCGYEEPWRLGADRWAALVGARRRFPGNCCIVSAGTALTADAMEASGRHLGGVIAPGGKLMERALLRETGAIVDSVKGLDAIDPAPQSWGRHTRAAIAQGTLMAVKGFVGRVQAAAQSLWGKDFKLILTGGDAGAVVEVAGSDAIVAPDLVLEGLAVMAREPS